MPDAGLPDVCPICSEGIDQGAHRVERVIGFPKPMIHCPAYSEFILDGSPYVLFDEP